MAFLIEYVSCLVVVFPFVFVWAFEIGKNDFEGSTGFSTQKCLGGFLAFVSLCVPVYIGPFPPMLYPKFLAGVLRHGS